MSYKPKTSEISRKTAGGYTYADEQDVNAWNRSDGVDVLECFFGLDLDHY